MAKKQKKQPRRGIAIGQTAMSVASSVEAEEFDSGVEISVNGLSISGQPSFERLERLGRRLRVAERGIQFAIGDYLNYIEERLGERASQIVDYTEGWSEKTCSSYRWVASRIAPEIRRMDRLTIAHHLLVAALTPANQQRWLGKAAADDEDKPWTVAHLRKAIKAGGDLEVTGHYVLVKTDSADAQSALMQSLEQQGYEVKAVVRRRPKDQSQAA